MILGCPAWKTEFNKARDAMNTYLNSKTFVTERVVQPVESTDSAGKTGQILQLVSETNLSYRDIMDIFIYGNAAHFEVSKKLVYERWKSNPSGFPSVLWEFDNLLLTVLKAIHYVAALSKEELARHSAGLPPS